LIYKYTNNFGEEFICKDLSKVSEVLDLDYKNWEQGSGDSAFHSDKGESLIFFKLEKGFFVMELSSYLSPKISDNSEALKHFVSGEPMTIPKKCICSKNQAYDIIVEFLINKKLHEKYDWLEI